MKRLARPLITLVRILRPTLASAHRNDCTNAAAAMAFDIVFAIFPGILVLTALLAILDIPVDAFADLIHGLGILVPTPMIAVVAENMHHLRESSQSVFALGIVGVIWPASASMSTTMMALNRAYGAAERRTFWLRRALSVVLVVSLGIALVVLFNLIAFSEQVEGWLRLHWTLTSEMPSLPGLVRRVATIAGTLLIAAGIYRIAPNVRQKWLDVMPGSLLFLALWTIIAGGFGYFVARFSYYNVIYGLLGGVIVLLLSAYLVSFILLLGGELNANLYKLRHEIQPEENR